MYSTCNSVAGEIAASLCIDLRVSLESKPGTRRKVVTVAQTISNEY